MGLSPTDRLLSFRAVHKGLSRLSGGSEASRRAKLGEVLDEAGSTTGLPAWLVFSPVFTASHGAPSPASPSLPVWTSRIDKVRATCRVRACVVVVSVHTRMHACMHTHGDLPAHTCFVLL